MIVQAIIAALVDPIKVMILVTISVVTKSVNEITSEFCENKNNIGNAEKEITRIILFFIINNLFLI